MRAYELTEGKNTSCIVVDVQPAYTEHGISQNSNWVSKMMGFLNRQNGPILMFVNAEKEGFSDDTVEEIKIYWEEKGFDPENWSRVTIDDKGYGYFRAWMDGAMEDSNIIKTIRLMYQNKVASSLDLFGGIRHYDYDDNMDYVDHMKEFLHTDYKNWDDPLYVEWTSVSRLKKFSGSYIMGGGRNECLKEVELLMNAFNIKYKEIQEFIY